MSGWWGHARPFDFDPQYKGHPGIEKFLCGTQPIISLRGVEAGLDVFKDLNILDVRAKSLYLTGLFLKETAPLCQKHGMICQTPLEEHLRSSQVSFLFEHGFAVIQALIAENIIADFRAPSLMRFGFSPLYITEQDVLESVEKLAHCLEKKVWEVSKFHQKMTVT